MIRLKLSIELDYQIEAPGCDFIFNVHAAHTSRQVVISEFLSLNQNLPWEMFVDAPTGNRYLRLRAGPGRLCLDYDATVEIDHFLIPPAQVGETPVARLPPAVLTYIYPSRYCQSDRLLKLAMHEFGSLWQGYGRAQAIQSWVQSRVRFLQNTSTASTSAVDTLIEQVGVCRDFAHLMIALCRAINIPARFATGIDYGADPALGPTDFHAYVEVFLGGRWYIFDPSGTAIPMGFVRLGTGRDAADVSFATIFGTVQSAAPKISIEAVANSQGVIVTPAPTDLAVSTGT
jgi:transglutaminase-like putative cysteine protease